MFDGDVISWERGGLIADGSSRHGKSSYQIKVWYTVYTEKSKYEFLLINYKENMIDPKLKGLYTLYAVDNTDGNTVKGTWQVLENPGVYKQEGENKLDIYELTTEEAKKINTNSNLGLEFLAYSDLTAEQAKQYGNDHPETIEIEDGKVKGFYRYYLYFSYAI